MSLQGLGEAIRWAPLGPGGDPRMSLQGSAVRYSGYGRRLGAIVPEYSNTRGLGAYGDQVNLAGRLGEVIRWGPLGPGGDPAMSLQGLPTTMDEVDWAQVGLGAVLGVAVYLFAKKQKYIK